MKPEHSNRSLLVGFSAFFCLGLLDAALGVAWPTISQTFQMPTGRLGNLLIAVTSGYLISSFGSGNVSKNLGLGTALVGATSIVFAGVAVFAAATGWHALVGSLFLVGLGAGFLDACINNYAATSLSVRSINWLHSIYGFGAMLSPLLIAAIYRLGGSWRIAYATFSIALLTLTFLFFQTRRLWVASKLGPDAPIRSISASYLETLRKPAVWTSIALFFVVTGAESVTGQWSYSLLTVTRRINPLAAAVCVAGFWISHAAGRVIVGTIADRVPNNRLLQLSIALAGTGGVLLSLDRGTTAALTALVVLGLGLAPLYPLLVATTSARVSARHTANTTGFQVSSGSLGWALLPALVGTIANQRGLSVVGPFLVVAATCLWLLHRIARRQSTAVAARTGRSNVYAASAW